MVSIKEVEELNARIEKINHEYTKKKTQQELLKERLEKEIKAYKEAFGVDLSAGSLAEMKEKISTEHKKVVSNVEVEYKLKLQVVKSIEDGDYTEAARLLGVEVETPTEEPVVSASDYETVAPDVDVQVEEENEISAEEADFGFDVDASDLDEATGLNEEPTVESKEPTLEAFPEMDDEDEVDALDFTSAVSSIKNEKPELKLEEEPEKPSINTAGLDLTIEDDDDTEEIDFGFGDMLSGTKFE